MMITLTQDIRQTLDQLILNQRLLNEISDQRRLELERAALKRTQESLEAHLNYLLSANPKSKALQRRSITEKKQTFSRLTARRRRVKKH